MPASQSCATSKSAHGQPDQRRTRRGVSDTPRLTFIMEDLIMSIYYLYRFRDYGDGTPPYRCGAYTEGLTPRVQKHAAAEARRSGHAIELRRPDGQVVARYDTNGILVS